MAARILGSMSRTNIYFSGLYQITGTVTELGAVGSYHVRLYDQKSGQLIKDTWSSAAGYYQFLYLSYSEAGYFAVAHDHGDNPLNAAIADLITPEPIP